MTRKVKPQQAVGRQAREDGTPYTRPSGPTQPAPGAIDDVLLAEPFDDPAADPGLSVEVDHYLYGAARRTARNARQSQRRVEK
jgi:hypothetical protein